MHTEIEAKFLNINPDLLRAKLNSLNARLVFPKKTMKRKNYNLEDDRLQKISGWGEHVTDEEFNKQP
jgi:hypothetical protein